MKKILFFSIWLGLIALSLFTLVKVTPLSFALSTPARLINFIQRGLGLLAFTLLFVQIILGAFMYKIIEKIGGWVFNLHVLQGIGIYFLVLLHPILFMFFNYYLGSKLDPYAVFVNACLICKTATQYYYTVGIISFWLLTLTVITAILRKTSPWFMKNWRKFHALNYLVFLAVGIHGFFLGTDFRIQPFYTFAIMAHVTIFGLVLFVELPRLFVNFKKWLNET